MRSPIEVKLDVPSQEIIDKLASDAPPLGMRCTPLKHSFHRDIYFDSRDKTLEKRGVKVRKKIPSWVPLPSKSTVNKEFSPFWGAILLSPPDSSPLAAPRHP